MSLPDRNIFVVATVNNLRAVPGQELTRYVYLLDQQAVFRWVLNSGATDDGFLAIVPITGGFMGAWLRERPNERGPNITSASFTSHAATIGCGVGYWQVIAASSLTANSTITLDSAGAVVGDWKEFTREDTTGYTIDIVNGGIAAGTLTTLPAGMRSFGKWYFDGVNFIRRQSSVLL